MSNSLLLLSRWAVAMADRSVCVLLARACSQTREHLSVRPKEERSHLLNMAVGSVMASKDKARSPPVMARFLRRIPCLSKLSRASSEAPTGRCLLIVKQSCQTRPYGHLRNASINPQNPRLQKHSAAQPPQVRWLFQTPLNCRNQQQSARRPLRLFQSARPSTFRSFNVDDHFNVHSQIAGKRSHTYGGARVFADRLAKDFHH